ncbi:hypothetical protein JOM56_014621 [Amanita muscaria]
MTLKLNDFAAELLHCIFRFCSQIDLASLSQVDSIFRQAAEDVLYRHIYISFFPFDLIPDKTWRSWAITEKSLFHTLASNPQKAALLRYLQVQFKDIGYHDATQANHSILGRIADALQNAPNLVDLRIMVKQYSEGKLSEAIRGGHFQLHTLYCDSFQDLEGIIVSQRHLRLLGIYAVHNYFFPHATELVKSLHNNRNVPGIFMLGSCGFPNDFSQLTLFPELYVPGQTFTLCRDIATSLGQDRGKRHDSGSMDDHHRGLEIQIVDFSYAKTAIICEVVEAMAECFVGCRDFSMRVQNSIVEGIASKPWRIPGLLTSISRFKQLRRLRFYVYDDDSLHQVAMDLRPLLLNELVPACPTLVAAFVNGSSVAAHMALDSDWNVIYYG